MTTTMTSLVGIVANDEVHTVLLLRPVEAGLTIEGLCLTTSKFKPHNILFSRSYLRVDMKCLCICVLRSNRSRLSHTPVLYAVKVVVVTVLTLKTVLTSIQYLLFLTFQGKETKFRGHKLTQNKVQKNKIKKTQRKSQNLRKNM